MALAFAAGFLVFALAAFLLRPSVLSSAPHGGSMDLLLLSVRYRPMLRLLDGADFQFLDASGDPKLIRRMRAERRAIFRSYLRCLRRDHARVCAQIRFIIVNSNSDRKDLAAALSRFEMSFQMLMVGVQVRLAMHALGLGKINAKGLMGSLDRIRIQAESLAGAPLMPLAA